MATSSKSLAVALCFILAACTSPDTNNVTTVATDNHVTRAILRALIAEDSLTLTSRRGYTRSELAHLRPIRFLPSRKGTRALFPLSPPPDVFAVSLHDLLYDKHFFGPQDTLFLLQQGRQQQEQLLDTAFFVPGTRHSAWPQERPSAERFASYRFSRPLFSQDSLKAYLHLDHTGSGYAILLERRK
jgi:hypothetical protein